MTTISWFYDKSAPLITNPLSTQTTYFATSSLASRARNSLSIPTSGPDGVYKNLLATHGVPHSGITIYDMDKSPVGVETSRIQMGHPITPISPIYMAKQLAPPNVKTLSRKDFLKGGL